MPQIEGKGQSRDGLGFSFEIVYFAFGVSTTTSAFHRLFLQMHFCLHVSNLSAMFSCWPSLIVLYLLSSLNFAAESGQQIADLATDTVGASRSNLRGNNIDK